MGINFKSADNHIMPRVITTLVILNKSTIIIYQRFLNPVINIFHPLFITHFFCVIIIKSAIDEMQIKCCKRFCLITLLLGCYFCHLFNIFSLRVH